AAAGALVPDRRAEIVVADEPTKRAARLADPSRIPRRSIRRGARRDRRIGLDRLLREARAPAAAREPAVIADRDEAAVERLHPHQPPQRADAGIDHLASAERF